MTTDDHERCVRVWTRYCWMRGDDGQHAAMCRRLRSATTPPPARYLP